MRNVLLFAGPAAIARALGNLLERWPLVVLIAFFASPIGPHIRWEYSYFGPSEARIYVSCTYLGSRGFITPADLPPVCPAIIVLDARRWRE